MIIINNNNNLLHLFNLLSYYAKWPWRPGGTPRQPLLLAAVVYPIHKLVLIVRFIHLIGDLKGTQFLVISSTTRKYNFKFRPKFEYNLSTSRHFTSPPPPLCLLHFTPLHFSHFVCLTSHHFTLPAIFFTSLQLTSRHFTLPPVLFTSLHLTSCHFTSPLSFPCLTSCHFTSPLIFSHSLHLISLHFTSHLSTSLHSTLCHFA